MREAIDKFVEHFKGLPSIRELKHLYLNDPYIRELTAEGQLTKLNDKELLKRLNTVLKECPLPLSKNTVSVKRKQHEDEILSDSDIKDWSTLEKNSDEESSEEESDSGEKKIQITSEFKKLRTQVKSLIEKCAKKETPFSIRTELYNIRKLIQQQSAGIEALLERDKRVAIEKLTMNTIPGNINPYCVTMSSLTKEIEKVVKTYNVHANALRPLIKDLQKIAKTSDAPWLIDGNEQLAYEKTFDIFQAALNAQDHALHNGHLKQHNQIRMRRLIENGNKEEYLVKLKKIELNMVNNATWPVVNDNHVEIAYASEPHENEILIEFDGPLLYKICSDVTWRCPVNLYEDMSLGEVGRVQLYSLDNRALFVYRFVNHFFTHFIAVISKDIKDFCFLHQGEFYEEIRQFYEPQRVLR